MNAAQESSNQGNPLKARILIPDDECFFSRFLPFCLKQADPGLHIVVAGTARESVTGHSRYVDRFFRLPERASAAERVADWRDILARENIDWLMPASETGIQIALEHFQELSTHTNIISLPSGESLAATMDKWLQFEHLGPRGVPLPETERLYTRRLPPWFPCIIKPRMGSHGRGIHLIPDAAAWRRFDFDALDSDQYIAQRYLEGHDIDCSVFCEDGEVVAYTVQRPLGGESGFAPRIEKLKFEAHTDVLEVTRRAMKALNWQGVAHLDLRIEAATGRCYLVEINPRYWASIMGSYYAGVNFPSIALRNSCGMALPPFAFRDRYYVSLGRLIKDTLRGRRDYGIGESQLRFFLADPMPAIARIWGKRKR